MCDRFILRKDKIEGGFQCREKCMVKKFTKIEQRTPNDRRIKCAVNKRGQELQKQAQNANFCHYESKRLGTLSIITI